MGGDSRVICDVSVCRLFFVAIAALYVVMSACLSVCLSVTTSFKKFEFVLKGCYKCNNVHRSILVNLS